MRFPFWKRHARSTHLLFSIGDDVGVGKVHVRRQDGDFDEALAESQRRPDTVSRRQFLGVGIRPKRLRTGAIIVLSVFLLFTAQAAHLQVMNGGGYRAQAEGNRVRVELIPSLRGIIYDRNHVPLATNTADFRLVATPADLPTDNDARLDLLTKLAAQTKGSVADYLSRLADADADPNQPMVLQEDVDYTAALVMMLNPELFPGVTVESDTQRSYITTAIPTLSHVLGYTGRINAIEYTANKANGYRAIDDIGKAGVEENYETQLRGTYGRNVMEVDAAGHATSVISKQDPVNGANLVLSIDSSLTAEVEKVLAKDAPKMRAAVVIEDPKTGELLADVSVPSYDANVFAHGIDQASYRALLNDPNKPLFDRAIAGTYPPGSTFKMTVAAGALVEHLIDINTKVLSTGGLQVGPYFFPDWKVGGHGITNVTRAIAESINTFFYYIGGGYNDFVGLGIERMVAYASKFGLGKPLGIDLPGEASGFLPTQRWKQETLGEKWYVGDTYNTAIGEGFVLTTPLQIANMTAVFANGGTLYQPRVAHAFEQNGVETPVQPTVLAAQVVDANAIDVVRQGMRQTVTSGSGRRLQDLPVTAAGKTGTAQWSTTKQTHAWFTAFAPYDDPQVVITVLVEEGGGGDVISVPIADEILKWYFTSYNVQPHVDRSLDVKKPQG